MYRVYQVRWGFSATTLTAVFAVYVLFLLATVLIFGSLSDHVGRRPVIITALTVDTAACVLFLLAHGVGALGAARALQGAAVGLAASALGAALLDLRPTGTLAPLVTSNGGTAGLALGALGTSVLVQYGPVPAAAIVTRTPALLLLGTVMAGLGFGPGNLGAYRVIMTRATASDRAGLIAAISTVQYLAFGLPALIAGVATAHFGLHDTALVYCVVIALLAVTAAAGLLFEDGAPTPGPRAAAPPPELPPGPCTVPPR